MASMCKTNSPAGCHAGRGTDLGIVHGARNNAHSCHFSTRIFIGNVHFSGFRVPSGTERLILKAIRAATVQFVGAVLMECERLNRTNLCCTSKSVSNVRVECIRIDFTNFYSFQQGFYCEELVSHNFHEGEKYNGPRGVSAITNEWITRSRQER